MLGMGSITMAADVDQNANSSLHGSDISIPWIYRLSSDCNLVTGLKIGQDFLNFNRNTESNHENLLENSSSYMFYGPSLFLTYKKNFNLGLSYSGGNDADMNHHLDFWLGYQVHPKISVFIDYKYLQINPDLGENEENGFKFDNGSEKWTFNGPMIGIDLNYPIADSGFIVFSTLGYTYLDIEIDADYKITSVDQFDNEQISSAGSGKTSEAAIGPCVDLGLSYFLQNHPQLSFNVGYKYQDYTSDSDWNVSAHSWAVGVNYLF
jgi:hypothetical protein